MKKEIENVINDFTNEGKQFISVSDVFKKLGIYSDDMDISEKYKSEYSYALNYMSNNKDMEMVYFHKKELDNNKELNENTQVFNKLSSFFNFYKDDKDVVNNCYVVFKNIRGVD